MRPEKEVWVYPSEEKITWEAFYQVNASLEQIVFPEKAWVWAISGTKIIPTGSSSLYLEHGMITITCDEPFISQIENP